MPHKLGKYLVSSKFTNNIQEAIENYLVFEGLESRLSGGFGFDKNLSVVENIQHLLTSANVCELEAQYIFFAEEEHTRGSQTLLHLFAKGDRRLQSTIKKANIKNARHIVQTLIEQKIIYIEPTRERLPTKDKNQKRKKNLRQYSAEDKIKFVNNFDRFWFFFVKPYANDIKQERTQEFYTHLHKYLSQFLSFGFEHWINDLIIHRVILKDILKGILQSAGYWNKYTEFDILACAQKGEIVLGECKWTSRPVCQHDLNKLLYKSHKTGIPTKYFVFFSKSGFSKGLLKQRGEYFIFLGLEELHEVLAGYLNA